MHGGDIYRNPVALDFSVNVNPCGVPQEVRQALEDGLSQVEAYPDLTCMELKSGLAGHFHTRPEQIVCGNGASELILAFCHWKRPAKALLLAPGFSGYEKALKAVGCETEYFCLQKEEEFRPGEGLFQKVREVRPELVFLANPANPTGVLLDRAYLTALCKVCRETETLLVLDECFLELTGRAEEYSMAPFLSETENLWILRAFTKSFAIPGIRLGYLLCGRAEMAEQMGEHLPEWNVSIPAQKAGTAAVKSWEAGYLHESVKLIKQERSFLSRELSNLGMEVFPSEANYLLFRTSQTDLKERLLEKGILIRDCRDYRGLEAGYYRAAVKLHKDNMKLIQAIQECITIRG